ncbi:MAG: DMT family transporter [Peptococcaceae bacterium]
MHSIIADLSLLFVALIWGLTFPAVKGALGGITPFAFLTIRFSIACLFLIILYPQSLKNMNKTTLGAGLLIGTALFSGYGFQTVGIQYTTASNAAFITGLAVVIVPLLNIPFSRKLPNRYAFGGALSAAVGLSLLTLNTGFKANLGDILLLFCAVSFAAHIVLVSKYAPSLDTNLLTIVQIGAVAFTSGLFALNLEVFPKEFTQEFWVALAICAIPATSLAYWIQNKVQKYTSPARTAIIFAMEPVFGAVFAYFWMGEILTIRGIAGCIFVLLGMLISELKS